MSSNKKTEKVNTKKFQFPRVLTVFMLLALLIIGLVSTTFASFVADNSTPDDGSLVARVQTAVSANREKKDLADTKADAEIAQTGATRTMVAGEYIYIENFKPSGWGDPWVTSDGKAYLYIWNSGSDGTWYPFELYSGSAGAEGAIYRAKVTVAGTYSHFISTRGSSSYTGGWYGSTGFWNQTGDLELSSSSNCYYGFTAGGTSRNAKVYAVPPSSVTASVTNAVSGSGTNADPYIVRPGASFSIKLTATKTDPGMEGFGWNINSSSSKASSGTSSTYTKSYTASTTEGTSTYTGYAWCYEGSTANYSSSYKTSNTIYVKVEAEKYTYTVTTGTGGKVSTTGGTVVAGSGVSITATPNTGYTFAEWTGLSKATLSSTTSATTTLTPTASGATVKANFRPDAPSALTLTGEPVASGTTGDGTQSNPFIIFENSGFTLTANATVVSGATAYYNSTNNSTNAKVSGQFTPPDTTKGETVSYAVYAWAKAGTYYSTNSKSATAHYMVFSHLSASNTGFSVSSNSITDADTLTLSGAYVNGVADAEKAYITQTYQVSTDNSTFSDLGGSTWVPNEIGTYSFRVKTTNIKTGETVYSSSQSVTVTQSTVYYDITVTNEGSVAGTVKLYADGVEITDGKILSNSELSVSIERPNKAYYIDYLEVDTLTEQDCEDVNGDIIKYVAYDHVKGNVSINYKILAKPTVAVKKPTNSSAISFKYLVDGVETTATTAGTYPVDYNSKITYAVTPSTGYYVSAMTGVTMGTISSSTVTGTKSGVTSNITNVTATLTKNNTVTVNVDDTSDATEGASMTIDSTAVSFGTPKALNYGAEAEVVITPPSGYYAVVTGDDIDPTIDTDGKATFSVILKGESKECTVKFVENPKIYMVQPQYGSVYVTSGSGNNIQYYFNGDSVGYGTELTVNVKRDHANATVNSVLVNDASIGTADGSKFKIYENSTATADITVKSGHEFENGTEYGQRRIFFTDNSGWGDGQVMVHYSNTNSNYTFTDGNTMAMTFKYVNDSNQRVYYADIPYNFKYVNFYKKSATSNYTASALINGEANAFWHSGGTSPYTITPWQENYSDFVATDREDTIQQATTVKDEAATFSYTCDFGDDTLSAEVVSGNAADVEFDRGVLSITPTDNSKSHTLVKVTSNASTTVKYYLVRVENFEITGFSGLQKIYNSQIFNNIQLDLIVKGGAMNYAAKLLISDSNKSGTYNELEPSTTSGFEYSDTLQAHINSFLIEHAINTISGVKYYKVEATDGAGHKATKTLRTLFGTNTYNGTRCVYFYNSSDKDISKYNLRACFNNANNTSHKFVTMQKVGNTDYYRAVVPNGFESTVNFYLTNPKTFSNNYVDYDGSNDTVETYYYGILNESIPETDDANIVYQATEISDTDGIIGEFTTFDY